METEICKDCGGYGETDCEPCLPCNGLGHTPPGGWKKKTIIGNPTLAMQKAIKAMEGNDGDTAKNREHRKD